jgi:hypothetical protein
LANVTDAQVRTMLGRMADEMQLHERGALKAFLISILDRVELDPENATLQLCYRIPLRGGVSVASHGDQSLSPPLSPVPWPKLHSDRARRH